MTPLARAAAAALLLGWLGSLGCTSAEERFAEHVARAEAYARENRPAEAILEYSSAINLDPASAEVHERLGDLLRRQGALEEAAQHYRQAHQLDPARVDAAMREVRLIVFQNRARADRLVARALEQHGQRPSVHRAVSEIALVDGNTERGLAAARRALDLDPEDAESWLQLARVQQGRIRQDQLRQRPTGPEVYQEALDALERAEALLGGDVAVRLERARVLAAWPGHDEAARAAYDDALALARERGDTDVRVIAAHALDDFARSRGDLETRRRALREVLEVAPEKLDAWRALLEVSAGDETRGEALLAELRRERPDDPRALRFYVSQLVERGRRKQALVELEGALERGVSSPALWDDLIRLRLRQGQIAEGRSALESLREAHPGHPVTRRAQARLALAEGRNAEAAEILRRTPEARESSEDQRLHALGAYRAGRYVEAREAIERAGALLTGFSAPVETLRARIACDTGEGARCLRILGRLEENGVTLRPEDRVRRAQALYGTGRRRRGRLELERLLAEPEPPLRAATEYARREGRARPERAQAYLEAAHQRAPGAMPVLQALAELDVAAGRIDRSIARLSSLEGGAGNPVALLLRADLLARSGALERAESDALRAFEARPGLSGAVDLLLAIYEAQRAVPRTRQAFEEAEEAGVLHPGARLLLARMRARAGEHDGAQALLEELIEASPTLRSARSELAVVLARQGTELGRALELAREASQGARPRREAVHALGYVYLRSGLPEAAVVALRRALGLPAALGSRSEPSLHHHLGLALRALDRPEQAAASFRTALELDGRFPEAREARQQLEELGKSPSEA